MRDHVSGTMHSDEPQVVLVVDNHSSKLGAGINQCQIWSEEQGFASQKFGGCLSLVVKPWPVRSSWNFGEDCRQGSTSTFVADAGVRIAVENDRSPASCFQPRSNIFVISPNSPRSKAGQLVFQISYCSQSSKLMVRSFRSPIMEAKGANIG